MVRNAFVLMSLYTASALVQAAPAVSNNIQQGQYIDKIQAELAQEKRRLLEKNAGRIDILNESSVCIDGAKDWLALNACIKKERENLSNLEASHGGAEKKPRYK